MSTDPNLLNAMKVRELPRPDRRSLKALLLVLLALAHIGVAVLLNLRHDDPRSASHKTVAVLRLDFAKPPERQPLRPQTPLAEPRLPLPVVVPIEPPRIEISTFNPVTQSPAAPQAPAAETAKPAPLNLALPSPPQAPSSAPQFYRNPALSDPRANTKRADYATRMADALGTDQSLREEAFAPGVRRFRQGTTCIEVTESRIANIDPFSNSMRPTPQLAKSCK